MKVQANVKAFEEYRRLIRDFKYQIEVQNEAMENQTRAAALQEGFIEMGDVFVKQGTLSGLSCPKTLSGAIAAWIMFILK